MMDLNKFFEWDSIEVRGSRSGVKKTTCPACSHTRKKKTDPCLYVNFDSGVAKCYNCERLSFRDSEPKQSTRVYELPNQDWRNYTALHDKIVEFCEARRIRQSTLMDFGITQEVVFMLGRKQKVKALTFNYFENETVVNKKYRDLQKNFTQSKGGKPIFYNINSAIGQETVYIVEGEFDVLAMYEAGIKNCISLPSGANDNDDYWQNSKAYLDSVKEFIIAVDNDEKGHAIRDKIAHRLGKYRCKYIEWNGKDANDDLISGHIESSIKNLNKFPVDGTFNAFDYSDEAYALYQNGVPKTIAPKKVAFGNMSQVFSTLPGQLTVWTGIPSHGKSNFCEWYILNLLDEYDYKASFFSPEHNPVSMHLANFAQKAIGRPFYTDIDNVKRMTLDDYKRFEKWSADRLYITAGGGQDVIDWKWIIEKFKEQIFTFGINLFVVDAWNKVQMPQGYNGKEGIDKVLTELTAFCQQNSVEVHLIAHPTKMRKKDNGHYEVPTLYDVAGSADFRNQAHNGCTIYRHFASEGQEGFTDFYNMKTKFGFQGKINEAVRFKYHVPTARYYVDGCAPYDFDLTQKGAVEPIDYNADEYIEPKKLTLNEDFDFEPVTECPF